MKNPSDSVIKHLFALSHNICAFPNCDIAFVQQTGPVTGKVCHIKGRRPDSLRYDPNQTEKERNSFENLILLCSVHHDIIDGQSDKFTVEALQEMKRKHEQSGNIKLSQDNASLVRRLIDSSLHIEANSGAQVIFDSPGAIQVKNLTLKITKKSIPSIQPLDAIGANIEMKPYVEYLIGRYIDWRKHGIESGKDSRPFHPSMIHRDVKKEFGARTNLISQSRFAGLFTYLQKRIDDTIEGKIWHSQGKRNYHTFDEHLAKLHGIK
ncbi:MAG: hypothetical protein NTW55_01840 [Planctomycetota bacterium]|nr:hypothetical protein [Planctomycetota bacterium]